MVRALEGFGLDPEHIARRMRFLVQRSERHESMEHNDSALQAQEMGCVGTLRRDAACLALLLEEDEQAKNLLRSSGEAWADIGLFAGYAILHLSGDTDWALRYANDLSQVVALLRAGYTDSPSSLNQRPASLSEVVEGRRGFDSSGASDEKPYLAASTASKRQLLNLLQAAPTRDAPELSELVSLVHRRLDQQPFGFVEGMRLHSYVRLLDSFSSGKFGKPERDWLMLMVLSRTEWLAAARSDTHHWERILNPEFVIDLDLLTLCVCAAENKLTHEIDDIMGDRASLVSLPWTIAKRLVRPKSAPQDRFR